MAILGAGARLPGATGLDELWSVLLDGRCTVQDAPPADRWRAEHFLNPDREARGLSYSFAGGYLAAAFDFDPAAFGISPREAAQMDPQQRLLLEVTWEALEDSGLRPSTLAGQRVGVFVGASSADYADVPLLDLGAIEQHFMVGNSPAVLANRISYALDLRGPSLTIDTACSSSIVALATAAQALSRGDIDLALVGGVNIFSSPAPFIGFSRAGMLSPTGRCRPFSASSDGYVRGEGAIVVVLGRRDDARGYAKPRALLRATGVNSDGRTLGITMPSVGGQRALIEEIYQRAGIAPQQLSFVEAHGTGTRVGDPIEARAIGLSLGQHRSKPLPIGSVKGNIGHLEAASGLAGLLKVLLAFEHRQLPATLHLDEINPDIDAVELGIRPVANALELPSTGPLLAGLCNYGFGGTNAHVILENGEPRDAAAPIEPPNALIISAHSRAALLELAKDYAPVIRAHGATSIAAEASHTRDLLRHRLVLDLALDIDIAAELADHAGGSSAILANAESSESRVLFVFSGNGSQWPGMGLLPYDTHQVFRETFDDVARRIRSYGGVCPLETMRSPDAADRLARTSVAQPYLFALQIALVAALATEGLRPLAVLGHSVGEVAAAHASGALSLDTAVRVIVQRSACQEFVRGQGRMAVLACAAERAIELCREAGVGQVEVAARNGPSSTTLSGPVAELNRVIAQARMSRLPAVLLELDYPFHHSFLDPGEATIREALAECRPGEGKLPFFSTVTGGEVSGTTLDAAYWWANIRQPVLFEDASAAALEQFDLVVEIGPRPILTAAIRDIARSRGSKVAVMGSLADEARPPKGETIRRIALEALARGAPVGGARAGAHAFAGPRRLPHIRWNHQTYVMDRTEDARGVYGAPLGGLPSHPLLGTRQAPGGHEWRHYISLETLPFLDGHRVADEIVFPATGYIEIIAALGREIFGTGRLRIEDLDLLRAMVIEPGVSRELSISWQPGDRLVEIRSRPRYGAPDAFVLHARAAVAPETSVAVVDSEELPQGTPVMRDSIYAAALAARLAYGGAFRIATGARIDGAVTVTELSPQVSDLGAFENCFVTDPASYDAAFHGIFLGLRQAPGRVAGELPVRIGTVFLYDPGLPVRRSVARLRRETPGARVFDVTLSGEGGAPVARLENLVMRRVTHAAWDEEDRVLVIRNDAVISEASLSADEAAAALQQIQMRPVASNPDGVRFAALVMSLAGHLVRRVAGDGFQPEMLAARFAALPQVQPIWHFLLEFLHEARALEVDDGLMRVRDDVILPEAAWTELLAASPALCVEVRLALQAAERLQALLLDEAAPAWNTALEDEFLAHSALVSPVIEEAVALVGLLAAKRPGGLLRVGLLEPGLAAILPHLAPLLREGSISLHVLATDPSASEAIVARFGLDERVPIIAHGALDRAQGTAIDLIVAAAASPLNAGNPSPLDVLAIYGKEIPPLLVAMPAHQPPLDVIFAAKPGWFDLSLTPISPVGLWPLPSETDEGLANANLQLRGRRDVGEYGAALLVAAPFPAPDAYPEPAAPHRESPLFALLGEDDRLRDALIPCLGGQPILTVSSNVAELLQALGAMAPSTEPLGLFDLGLPSTGQSEREMLQGRVLRLRELAIALSAPEFTRVRIYVVTRDGDAVSHAITSFTRCLMNEFPGLAVCTLSVPVDGQFRAGMTELRDHVAGQLGERELQLTPVGMRVNRMVRLQKERARPPSNAERTVLRIDGHRSEELRWFLERRGTLQPDEVEVEVAATGLNFRDVMLSLGLLDDEILGEGVTRGSLGFEFAGRISAMGASVSGWAIGDAVMGFGSGAFASHLISPASRLMRTPVRMAPDIAASIPVVFATAWYSLIDQARLRAGETVLIHGAAGGVGLAALQIAKMVGARIVALAGTAEKRSLLQRLGADLVLDSRSSSWAQDVSDAIGGVDVALNSVAGEAMRATLKLVRPFGRFVELGKRDFLDNTRLGLRPFVRNISYFGVDIDQLLAHSPDIASSIMSQVTEAMEAGRLQPLPVTFFPGNQVQQASRLMQRSGHIGKILVRPHLAGYALPPDDDAFCPAGGAHIVIGGTGGFGLATAIWLAERGARTVIVASRSGKLPAGSEAAVAAIRARGFTFLVETLDVTKPADVTSAFERWRAEHGSIAGIVHSAMVLDDGLITGITPERLAAVLAPKVDGLRAIADATTGDALQYLVAYSSATTLIGSPGQGAYVAANAFLEGVVQELRGKNVPALAVCWGAIGDVGVVERTKGLAERLRQTTGVSAISSAEALQRLGTLLADPKQAPAFSAYSAMRWTSAARKLVTLSSPLFAEVFNGGEAAGKSDGEGTLNLAGLSDAQANEALQEAVSREVARILRLPLDAVDPDRPLIDVGLDSLMALELRLGLEQRLGIELPQLSLGGNRSVRQLAERIRSTHKVDGAAVDKS